MKDSRPAYADLSLPSMEAVVVSLSSDLGLSLPTERKGEFLLLVDRRVAVVPVTRSREGVTSEIVWREWLVGVAANLPTLKYVQSEVPILTHERRYRSGLEAAQVAIMLAVSERMAAICAQRYVVPSPAAEEVAVKGAAHLKTRLRRPRPGAERQYEEPAPPAPTGFDLDDD